MMRLIDADVLIAEICQDQCERKYCDCDYTCSVVAPIVNAPTIPAVPLDKLCEWLEKNATMDCDGCHATIGSCEDDDVNEKVCNSRERWKKMLTKWMEGQHET